MVSDGASSDTSQSTNLSCWLKSNPGGISLAKEERAARDAAIFDHWLAGKTIWELAQKGNLSPSHVHDIITAFGKSKLERAEWSETPPIYNVWNFSICDPRFGQKHPGQIPGQAILNLLLWLTEPFDFVVDPMAGGGPTIDVCKYLLRRYRCFDIDPKRPDVEKWDIRNGYPPLPYKPKFILLDPPYWRLKRDQYSQDGVANLCYSNWLEFMAKLATDTYRTLKSGGTVALFIQSFWDEWETGEYIFANYDCFRLFLDAKFKPIMEISLNMPSQTKDFRDVIWAKKYRKLLSLKRDILVFRKPQ